MCACVYANDFWNNLTGKNEITTYTRSVYVGQVSAYYIIKYIVLKHGYMELIYYGGRPSSTSIKI